MTTVHYFQRLFCLLGISAVCSQIAMAVPSLDYILQFPDDAYRLHYEFENKQEGMLIKYAINQYLNDKKIIYKNEYQGPGFCNPTELAISATSLTNQKTTQGWLITITPADYCMGANNDEQKPLANSSIYHIISFNQREKRFLDSRYVGFGLTSEIWEQEAVQLQFKKHIGPARLNVVIPQHYQVMSDGRQLETVYNDESMKQYYQETAPNDRCAFERYVLAKCLDNGAKSSQCQSQNQTYDACTNSKKVSSNVNTATTRAVSPTVTLEQDTSSREESVQPEQGKAN